MGESIGVYHLYDGDEYELVRVVNSYDFRDTFGESGWERLQRNEFMKYGYSTLYLYLMGQSDFPKRYIPVYSDVIE